MKRSYIGNKAVLEWFGDEILSKIANVKSDEERATAERVYRSVLSNVPTGSYRRSYRHHYTTMRGKILKMKAWQQRIPGRLRSSVAKFRSRFSGGGWIVWAGSYLAYYARIVEYGTKMRRQKTTGRFTGRAKASKYMKKTLKDEQRLFLSEFKKRLRAKLRVA